jgi:hypothetical protein
VIETSWGSKSLAAAGGMPARRLNATQPQALNSTQPRASQRGATAGVAPSGGRGVQRLGRVMRMRMRVEIMGSPNCRIVGESQPVLVLLDLWR